MNRSVSPFVKFIFMTSISIFILTVLGLVTVNALVVESQKNVNILEERLDYVTQEHRSLITQEVQVKSAKIIVEAAKERGMVPSQEIEYIQGSNTNADN